MKSKRTRPWPKREDAEQSALKALKFIMKCRDLGVGSTLCYCRDDGECCWCGALNSLKELRYSRK